MFARSHASPPVRTSRLALAVLLTISAGAAFAPFARAAGVDTPAAASAFGDDGPALLAPLAAQSLLLDLAAAGSRVVAVGERGHVLLSDDQGQTWRQVPTPTRATLTAVAFADALHGWAVGHLGTILRTVDSGETWQRLTAGLDRESVLLDVRFLDANDGFAVGAYGLFLRTRDGGATWKRSDPQPDQYHFNSIARTSDGAFFLAGEAGTLLRSRDGGLNWEPVPPPYEGSLFGLVSLADGQLLVHGLRGHVFRSNNGGAGWQPVATPVPTLLMHGLRLRNGLVILAGQSGNFLVSRDQGQSFELWRPGGSLGVAALLEAADGALIAVGEKGVRRLEAPPRIAPAATP
ncbi:MAG TPA: YCF48-related protein [Opitutaceae bacterium]|nr:YCF48-related protein [Opitutaceae bacterium]